MRVLLLGPYPPPHGGIQTHIVALRIFLRNHGIDCRVINITRFRQGISDGVYHPKNALELLGLLLRLQSNIIHIHLGGSLTSRLLGLCFVCSLWPRRKAVLTLHSGGYPSSQEGRTAGSKTVRGFIFRRLDRVIGVNDELTEMFRKFGVPEKKVRMIPPHTSPPTSDEAFPEPLKSFFRQHDPVLLTVGLLEPEYEVPMQIEVLSHVRQQHPQAGLVIIGDGSLKRDLLRLAQAKLYHDHILLCGDVPHAVTLQAMKECAMLLRTTRYDGDSIAVREALHLGAPVIATDNGMRPTGVHLVPIGDSPALLRAIEGNIGRARQFFATPAEQNLESILQLYRELV